MKIAAWVAAAVLVFALYLPAAAQQNPLVGTWKLVSVTSANEKGEVNKEVFGTHPSGQLTYTADGRINVIVTEDGRKPLSIADNAAPPPEERAQAFATVIAYAGRYTFSGDRVTHHVEVASIPNWVNTDLVRMVTLVGDRLTLRTSPESLGGSKTSFELIWERVK